MTSQTNNSLGSLFINVRIGLGGECYMIMKEDIPLVRKFLKKIQKGEQDA